jgi:hypothetical protein
LARFQTEAVNNQKMTRQEEPSSQSLGMPEESLPGEIVMAKLGGTKEGIADDTPIIRYMKLETFLLLLAGQVFIPSHDLLRSLDQLEGELVFKLPVRFWEDHEEEIRGRFETPVLGALSPPGVSTYCRGATVMDNGIPRKRSPEDAQADFRIWLSGLSRRRCVWCWNRFENYSHALWQLYGDRGVAVSSTVGKVKDALLKAGVRRGKVAPVGYVNLDGQNADEVFPNWENVFFPHLLKSATFKYEEEIRFLLRAQYDVINVMKGVMAQIDPGSIVESPDQVKVSPQLRPEEQNIVQAVIRSLVKERQPVLPLSKRWADIYKKCNQQRKEAPFPTEDNPPKALKDLD